jgi:hypothetical protein
MARTRANPQAVARSRRFGSYQNDSREIFWYDWGRKPYMASDSGPYFDHVRWINFFGAIPEARRRRLDGLAGLGVPDVRFADRIEVVARDARAAAAWSRPSQALDNTPAANEGMFHAGIVQRGSPTISIAKFWRRILKFCIDAACEATKRHSGQLAPSAPMSSCVAI